MSINDLKIIKNPGYARQYGSEDWDTAGAEKSQAFVIGEPVKMGGTGTNFVILLVSGDPLNGTDVEFVGITSGADSSTSSADGFVSVTLILPMETVIRGKAQTASNVNTAAKILALRYDWVFFERASNAESAITVDEDQGDSGLGANGIQILTGDPVAGTLDIIVSGRSTSAAGLRSGTA
ncbi:MAG TPA: hypothetical protein ENI13_02010 [candidate division CPR3 bacterium]|uniref:Uncharacterized protein n=1 Tax=candidate division CPR3 bacterium TaxID=2268181 RepID=A0A7C1SQ22_UNCC3|nr:hypothetical protein [candidate division CPR3 bacterium]